MKRFISFVFTLLFLQLTVAQNSFKAADGIGCIALCPIVVEESGVPSYAQKVLSNKLKEIVTRKGLSSTAVSPRFVITASVNLLQKEITSTAPSMTAVELSTTLYIGDAVSGELFSLFTYDNIKGIGTNDQRAYLSAFKNLKANQSGLDSFIEQGKQKILDFYNSQIDNLLNEANVLSSQQKYNEAIVLLAGVPNECKDAYTKAMEAISKIYQKKIDVEGAKYYNQANAAWGTNKSKEGAKAAIELLANINPLSSSASAGKTLVRQIESHYGQIWDYKMMVEGEERQLAREKMALEHELGMRLAESNAVACQMALNEVKSTADLFVNGSPLSVASNLVTKICGWFE